MWVRDPKVAFLLLFHSFIHSPSTFRPVPCSFRTFVGRPRPDACVPSSRVPQPPLSFSSMASASLSPPPLPLSPLKMSSNIFFQKINFLHEFSPVSFEIIFFTNVRKRLSHPLFYPFRWKNKFFRNISHDICGGEGEGILRNDVSKRVGDGWGG